MAFRILETPDQQGQEQPNAASVGRFRILPSADDEQDAPEIEMPDREAVEIDGQEFAAGQTVTDIEAGIPAAAAQRTSPIVRDFSGEFIRPVVGEIAEVDGSAVAFGVDEEGNERRFLQFRREGSDEIEFVDPETQVVLQDPRTGKATVFERTEETDESTLLSIGRILLPGLLTGPVTAPGRAAGAAARSTTPAARTGQQVATQAQTTGQQVQRAGKADKLKTRVADVEAARRLDVTPFGPAVGRPEPSGFTKQLSDTPIVGDPLRSALERTVGETREAANRVASQFGAGRGFEDAGDVVQGGIERFSTARGADTIGEAVERVSDQKLSSIIRQPARATSFSTKAEAAYERAWRALPSQFKATGQRNPQLVPTRNAKEVLDGIIKRNQSAGIEGSPLRGRFSGAAERITNPQSNFTLEGMRNLRTEIGRMLQRVGRDRDVTLDDQQLRELYGAVSRDIEAALKSIADRAREASKLPRSDRRHVTKDAADQAQKALDRFRQADRLFKAGQERIDRLKKIVGAQSREQAAQRIIRIARDRGRGNLRLLRDARRALRDDEWADFTATLIREMGTPRASSRGLAARENFSVSSFATAYENMSDEAKSIMFRSVGGQDLRQAMDDLVRTVNSLAEFEALANTSRSATNLIGLGGGALAIDQIVGALFGNIQGILSAVSVFGAGWATAKFMSSPAYVRWITDGVRVRRRIAQAGRVDPDLDPRWLSHVERLRRLAEKQGDPQLEQLGREVAEGLLPDDPQSSEEDVTGDRGQTADARDDQGPSAP